MAIGALAGARGAMALASPVSAPPALTPRGRLWADITEEEEDAMTTGGARASSQPLPTLARFTRHGPPYSLAAGWEGGSRRCPGHGMPQMRTRTDQRSVPWTKEPKSGGNESEYLDLKMTEEKTPTRQLKKQRKEITIGWTAMIEAR